MSRDKRGFRSSSSSFATTSDYGSMTSSMSSERLSFKRRDYIKREDRDETYGSMSCSERYTASHLWHRTHTLGPMCRLGRNAC
jgi:hypothetical protein